MKSFNITNHQNLSLRQMNKFLRFFLLLSLLGTISSCTFVRTVRYFRPSTLDHEKVFVCDTIKGVCYSTYTAATDLPPVERPAFINANRFDNLPALEDWVPMEHRLGTTNLNDFLVESKTTAFIVIRNDSILYERYLNGGSPEKARIVFSVTKAVTATLAAIAQEEGYWNIDQKVADFIPAFGKDERRDITIRHLMNMVSGLDWMDHDNVIRLGFLYYTKNQEKFIVKNAKLRYPPGTYHAYKSLSTQILGICLEKAIGKNIAEYLEEKIWQPISMKHNAFMTVDSEEEHNSRTFGGLALTAPDMARFGKLLLNEGRWEGKQIIPKWFMKRLISRNPDMSHWGNIFCYKRNGYEDANYKHNQHFWASGYAGQFLYVSPKHNMLIIRQGNEEKNQWNMFMGRLASLMTEGKNDIVDKSMDYGEQFEGEYQNEDGQTFSLKSTEKDAFNRRVWIWERDKEQFDYHKKLKTLYQFDGVSAGYKKHGHQTRLFFDIKEGKVLGFYYYTTPTIESVYFRKIE